MRGWLYRRRSSRHSPKNSAVFYSHPSTYRGFIGVVALLALAALLATSVVTTSDATGLKALKKKPAPAYVPPSVKLSIAPALAGEGRWKRADSWDKGPPSVMTTTFRPAASSPSVVAFAAWIRTSSTRLGLYPGYKGPGPSTLNRGPEEVPLSGRRILLATFNSGFYESDSAGGFYTHGTTYDPMIKGLATLVEYTNGKMDIENWSGATTPPSTVLMARQNLHLLVVHSRIDPDVTALNVETGWGFTLHGDPAVWRTGVGVDRFGNLIYIAAPSQTPETFAALFLRLNCVRAMQLDINPEWPIFITYAAKDAGGPSLGFPNSNQVADRFLYPSTKDFFAVYEREKTQPQPPW